MRPSAVWGILFCAISACGAPTEAVPGVSLTIKEVGATGYAPVLGFQYAIANVSRDTVWVPACGGVIRLDVTVQVSGRITDTYGGSLCLANVYMGPAAIAPGATYRGEGAVQALSGATFTPSVTVSLSRTLSGPARRVTGASFGPS